MSTPAAQFPRATATELATALGVHRNSVSRWASEGAPAGPPYCELAWRTWAAAQGRDCPERPEQALLELLARAGIPQYRRWLDEQRARATGQEPAAPPSGGTGKSEEDPVKRKARVEAELRELDLAERRKQLVPIAQVHRLAEGLAQEAARLLDDVPRLVDALPLGPDDRLRVRDSLVEQLAARRRGLVASLEQHLATWLAQAPQD